MRRAFRRQIGREKVARRHRIVAVIFRGRIALRLAYLQNPLVFQAGDIEIHHIIVHAFIAILARQLALFGEEIVDHAHDFRAILRLGIEQEIGRGNDVAVEIRRALGGKFTGQRAEPVKILVVIQRPARSDKRRRIVKRAHPVFRCLGVELVARLDEIVVIKQIFFPQRTHIL